MTAGLPSTTIAGASDGQTLTNLVNNSALGGLSVASTAGFGTTTPSTFLLLGQSGTDFALVQYAHINGSSFTDLSQPAGNGTTVLSSKTTVTQSPVGTGPTGNAQAFQTTPFSLSLSTADNQFAPSGYLYVQGQHGNEILQYASQSFASGVTTFSSCTVVGSFGTLSGNPYSDQLNAGAFAVQSSAPTSGQTTSINSTQIVVSPNVGFSLPVVSTTGFTTPRTDHPGYALVYYTPTTPAVVSYTGIEANPTGGFNLTGCLTTLGGTIGAYGVGGPALNVVATSADPIDFSFTNNSAKSPIYVAIAGQQINTSTGETTYGYLKPQSTDGKVDLERPWQFESLAGQAEVPTYTLFSSGSQAGAVQKLLIPNDPYNRLDSVRLIFSVSTAPTITVTSGKPNFPAPGNPSDPNNDITYDFVEFTERSAPNDGVLFINTTQVDQVGIPFVMQTTPIDAAKSNGVGVKVSRPQMFADYASYINAQFGTATGVPALASKAFQALTTPNRLLNPSDALSNPPNPAAIQPLNGYFDGALAAFFSKYAAAGKTFLLQRDGFYFSGKTITNYSPPAYSTPATNNGSELLIAAVGNAPTPLSFAKGETVSGPGVPAGATISGISVDSSHVTHLTLSKTITAQTGTPSYSFQVPNKYVVLQLEQTDSSWTPITGGQKYAIYAPFFNLGSGGSYPKGFIVSGPLPPPPPWLAPASSGAMVFGNLGVFADGSVQAANGQISGSGASAQTLLDIENTIVSAFNRGVANSVPPGSDVTAAWDNNLTYYPAPNGTGTNWSNFYAGFLHNAGVSITAPGSNVGLAYGFAYDDQGGNDPTLTSSAARVAITLESLVTTSERVPLRVLRSPRSVRLARDLEALSFALGRARPRTDYVVHVLRKVNGTRQAVLPPLTVRSDMFGRLRVGPRHRLFLQPGDYELLVRTDQNAYSTAFVAFSTLR